MQIYRHRQVGTLILSILGPCVVAAAAIALFVSAPEARIGVGVLFVVLLLCLCLFWALDVAVSAAEIAVSFGPGLIRRRIRVSDVHGARAVRNRWWYGWGIRLTPHGWLFNVSGFDAVELELEGDRRFRIGTDDPHQLVEAIERARELAG